MDGGSYDTDFNTSTVGFHVGAVLDWRLWKSLYIQPGFYYTTKGGRIKKEIKDETISGKTTLDYLQIPVLVSYHFHLGENTKLHISAGPYIAFAVGGKDKLEYIDSSGKRVSYYYDKNEADIFGNDHKRLNLIGFDDGLVFGAGVSFRKIYAGLNYDLGLFNFLVKESLMYSSMGSSNSASSYDHTMKNQSFNISVGYNF